MFHVKICGITSVVDAQAAVEAGADAIGLNFYAGSPRFLEPDGAESIARAVPAGVVKAGVFVNSAADKVLRTRERLNLDLIQLHGDEPPELIAQLEGWPVMRAFRYGAEGIAPIATYLDRCRELGCMPALVLLDAAQKGQYGGTGKPLDWTRLAAENEQLGEVPLILAGGLTAENVQAAIAAVRPAGVDTAGGVESAPGRKDVALVRAFVSAAKTALEAHP